MSQKLNAHPVPGETARRHLFADQSSTGVLKETQTDELVIALCGPIGTPLQDVAHQIGESLRATFGYDVETVCVSDFVRQFADVGGQGAMGSPVQRWKRLASSGAEMQRKHGKAVLAELAVKQIRVSREFDGRDSASRKFVSRRVCHIVQSIKNPQEMELLRTVYREVLYVVGVYSPVSQREIVLRQEGLSSADIAELMDPESGAEIAEGQSVDEAFPQCDYFLRSDLGTAAELQTHVHRFLHLVLGTRLITPTREESAMHAAASAAGNSACLSRQVGAAVADAEGEILAIGWNDVPRPFGGLYVTDPEKDPAGSSDNRCWNQGGICHNDEEKRAFSAHVLSALSPFIEESRREEAAQAVFKDQKLRGLLEFSRAVHAEMHALLTALRHAADRVRGARLFVTTYPCHVCARHLIAAGIASIFFIEPYKKSLAMKLHGDALSEFDHDVNKVRLIPYEGVAPTRYLSFFRMTPDSRKQEGQVIRIAPRHTSPRLKKSLEALPVLEGLVIESLRQRNVSDRAPRATSTPGVLTHESPDPT